MNVFVDTSGFYAMLVENDVNHESAKAWWTATLLSEYGLVTSNYVVVETGALLQSRVGLAAVRRFVQDVLSAVEVQWVSPEIHEAATDALLSSNRRGLSLIDCSSFALMRRLGITDAFTFDPHFAQQGFAVRP